jgi:hypothetical protein
MSNSGLMGWLSVETEARSGAVELSCLIFH